MPSFRYILRYQIDPGFHEEDRIDELVSFCSESLIEEVMLFVTPEELSAGHPTDDEIERYIATGKRVRTALDQAGIAMSLNPWTTIYHVARGRRLRAGQQFQLMVGETGAVSPIAACPLCTQWQQWLCRTSAHLVAALQPTVFWVEDDWRLHNHDENMGFGGCFCELHMQRFGNIINQTVSREEIMRALLQPGTPHPWREKWFALWRDTLLEPASLLKQALHNACPSTRLGLMSSVPDIHSIEGRNWRLLQDALGMEPAFITRPHLPPYTVTRALNTTPAVTRQTIANLKRPIEIYPELENSPRSGQYSKSHTYSAWECLHSAGYGSHGITINHYDMMGNGISLDPGFGQMLKSIKPQLNAMVGLNIDDDNAQGLQILFSPEVARHLDAGPATSLSHLRNQTEVWSDTAYILGISHRWTSRAPTNKSPVAVGGQTLRAFPDDTIRQLLNGPVILDAISVEVLLQRGFGELIGIQSAEWRTLSEDGYAYEQIDDTDSNYYGLAYPRMSAQRCATRLLKMRPAESAITRTTIHRADHAPLFPGMMTSRNALGGTVAAMAYPFDGKNQFYMGFFNVYRRRLMHRLLQEIAPEAPLAVVSSHPMHLYDIATTAGRCVVLLNPLHDPADRPTLQISHHGIDPKKIQLLQTNGIFTACQPQCSETPNGYSITLPTTVNHLQACVLLFPN